ncbi:MAG: cupin domain-containing protein [Rhodospirillales bacterium]|nr:cupin domain-containing protein [Rhodospirillales bacterium]
MPIDLAELDFDVLSFDDDGCIPNNPQLPLLLYGGVLKPDAVSASACESLFAANGWGGGWRNGIYGSHHFHSTAHEVLGIVRGRARVTFGGPEGKAVEVRAGDVAVVPAGTGHKREDASGDLLVIGAYPGGMRFDTLWGDPAEHDRAVENISRVPVPDFDPVFGSDGPLIEHWRLSG